MKSEIKVTYWDKKPIIQIMLRNGDGEDALLREILEPLKNREGFLGVVCDYVALEATGKEYCFKIMSMIPSKIKIGDEVSKIADDYTNGRTGFVIEIGQPGKPARCRVNWLFEGDGRPVKFKNGIKTWCKPEVLKII